MQNKNKITALTLLILGCFTIIISCNNNNIENGIFFRYHSKQSDSIIPLNRNQNISLIKDNLYFNNGNIHIGLPLFEDIDVDDKIVSIKKGIVLLYPPEYNLSIDTSTYHFIIKELIARDKNNIIAYPRGNYKFPFLQVLELNPSKTVMCDSNGTYLKDDSLVYCIPTNTYLKLYSKDFDVFHEKNLIFTNCPSNSKNSNIYLLQKRNKN